MPDFGRVLDVRPDAGTSVVIADADDAERLAGVGGELAQIDNVGRLVARSISCIISAEGSSASS